MAPRRGWCAPRRCSMKSAETTRVHASERTFIHARAIRTAWGTQNPFAQFHTLVHEFRCKYQMDAAGFERRDAFGEGRDCGGPWVADGDGESIALRIASGEVELLQDRATRRDVVE